MDTSAFENWQADVQRWLQSRRGISDELASDIVSFFDLAFQNTRCPDRAWFGIHSSTVSGRIRSIHCKDWAAGEDKGYRVLFGEGDSPWPNIFKAAEATGGVEYYLIEQEGSRFSSMETAERCLATYKKLRS